MKMWAHYERDSYGHKHVLEISSDHAGLVERMESDDWLEEQKWVRYDQEED